MYVTVMNYISKASVHLCPLEPSESWPPSLGCVLLLAGVVTFALQLLIVAVFFYKFWNYDKQIREARETREKQPKLIMKGNPSSADIFF